MTTKQIIEHLKEIGYKDVQEHSIYNLLKTFGDFIFIERNERNERVFTEQNVQQIRQILDWQDQGLKNAIIKEILNQAKQKAEGQSKSTETTDVTLSPSTLESITEAISDNVKAEIVQAIQQAIKNQIASTVEAEITKATEPLLLKIDLLEKQLKTTEQLSRETQEQLAEHFKDTDNKLLAIKEKMEQHKAEQEMVTHKRSLLKTIFGIKNN